MGLLFAASSSPALPACNGSGIRGGWIAGIEPHGGVAAEQGRVDAVYRPERCRDEAGQGLDAPRSTVSLMRGEVGTSSLVLVERDTEHPALYVDNQRQVGLERVFAIALKSHDGPPTLREYRFGRARAEPGRMLVADRWAQEELDGDAFLASQEHVVLTCELVPDLAPPPLRGGG